MRSQRLTLRLAFTALMCYCVTCGKEGGHHSGPYNEMQEIDEALRTMSRRRLSPAVTNRFINTKRGSHSRKKTDINGDDNQMTTSNLSGVWDDFINNSMEYYPGQWQKSAVARSKHGRFYGNSRLHYGSRESEVLENRELQLVEDQSNSSLLLSNFEQSPSRREKPVDPFICLGRKNGIYEGGLCEPWYLSCRRGKAKKILCADGLYWNSDESRCEPKENIRYCRLKFDCTGLDDGVYVDGCSDIFWFCAGETASFSKCSKGLFFNVRKMRCDIKKRVVACGGIDDSNKRSTKKKEIKSKAGKMKSYKKPRKGRWQIAYTLVDSHGNNVCEGRPEGKYALRKCYSKYLLCFDGKGLIVKCRNGNLFSRKHGRCVDAMELSCIGMETAKLTTLANYQNAKAKSFPPFIDAAIGLCDSLPDGNYQIGDCEEKFLICAGGLGGYASCSKGLAFNGLTKRCDDMHNIERCSQFEKEMQNKLDVSVALDEDEDCRCKGQQNGLYAIGCTEKFYSCSNGISTGFECPDDLVFNMDGGFCDDWRNVVACGGQPPVVEMSTEKEQEYNLASGCSVLDDGIYGLSPCGAGYYHCWHGATSFARCAFDLVFNPSVGRCDSRTNVQGCPQYNETLARIDRKIPGFTVAPVKGTRSKCIGLSDGFYGEGCSEIYYGCANEEVFYMNCPSTLVFDSHSGTCREPRFVADCRNGEEEVSVKNTPMKIMPSCTVLSNGPHGLGLCLEDFIMCRDGTIRFSSCPESSVFSLDQQQCDSRAKVAACKGVDTSFESNQDPQCINRPDGIFSSSCSENFHICAKGTLYRFACPKKMVYDSEFNRCENPTEVQTCLQIRTSTSVLLPDKSVEDQNLLLFRSSGEANMAVTNMSRDGEGACKGRLDGNFADGPCSTSFFSCVNMVKIPLSCPGTLVFDARTSRCEERRKIPQCTTSAEVLGDFFIEKQEITEQIILSTSASYLKKFICSGRRDGLYPLDVCLRSYLLCYNQRGSVEYCPENMTFDGSIGACTPRLSCTKDSPFTPVIPPSSASTTTSISTGILDCSAQNDGIYAVGPCMNKFVQCANKISYILECPPDLVFFEQTKRCEYPSTQCITERAATFNAQPTGVLTTRDEQKEVPRNYFVKEESENHFCVPKVSYDRADAVQCGIVEDGVYALDCSNRIIICNGAQKIIRRCSKEHVFVAKLRKCVKSLDCKETYHCEPDTVAVTYVARFDDNMLDEFSSDLSCADKPDGNYGEHCSVSYIRCSIGVAVRKDCAEGQVFDQRSGRCVSSDNCGNLLTATLHQIPCVEGARYGVGYCSDYYYTCLHGEFVVAKCPSGDSFDAAQGICGNKCDLCGCLATEQTTTTPLCHPGEVIARGPCLDTYMECNKQQSFQLRRCLEGKRFDSELLICQPYDKVMECFSYNSTGTVTPVWPYHHVDDSFQPPRQLSPNLQSIFTSQKDRIVPASHFTYGQPIMPGMTIPHGLLRTAPLESIFVSQTAPLQPVLSAFGSVVGPPEPIRDTFNAAPAPYGSVPFGDTPNLRIIDQFRPPDKPPYSFPVYPVPAPYSSEPLVALSSHVSKTAEDEADDVEGSGEDENEVMMTEASVKASRMKRDASFKRKLEPSSNFETSYTFNKMEELCLTKMHSANVAIGSCRPYYISCEGKGKIGHVVTCTNDKLFDDVLQSCVLASVCKRRARIRLNTTNETALALFNCSNRGDGGYSIGCSSKFAYCAAGQKHMFVCQSELIFDDIAQQCRPSDLVHTCKMKRVAELGSSGNQTFKGSLCDMLPDGTYSLASCSQHFLSCISKRAHLRMCSGELYYDEVKRHCNHKELVRACMGDAAYKPKTATVKGYFTEARMAVTNALNKLPSVLPNFSCSDQSTISLGCSQFFIVCDDDIAYMFHCDNGLVFDQATNSCNRVEVTPECQSLSESGDMLFSSSSTSGISLQDLVDRSSVFNFSCANLRNGVHAFQCSPFFYVCSDGQMTVFACQNSLVFNLETGFCDQESYISSCGEARLVKSPVANKMTLKSSFIINQPSYHSTNHEQQNCAVQFNGVISKGCSSEFILCAHGVEHLFTCQQGLLYNIQTNRCDYAKNIVACSENIPYMERAYERSHFENSSLPSIRIVDLKSSILPNTMKVRCSVSGGQVAAYGRCRMDYITCPIDGIAHQSYCTSDYLFDEDVGRCVPAKVCGTTGDIILESMSLTKSICEGLKDGIAKGYGPCLNHYYVCTKSIPIRRRCFKHMDTFSTAAGTCVPRSQNPECKQQSFVLTDGIKEVNSIDNFCVQRSDGIYRHPEDCTRILQCFGEEVFEHLPCTGGLVFNEVSGGCDYRSNVPDCATSSMKDFKSYASKSNCQEKSHGDFTVDEEDCSVYYRCVWGRLEKMFCPEQTVFNPVLSVCDYPNEVPYCKIGLWHF